MLTILFKTPLEITQDLGLRAKEARLAEGFTRETLAERSGVPASTIKRFETTGEIGTAAMIDIAIALGMTEGIEKLFEEKPIVNIHKIPPKRKRGVK